MKYIRTKDSIDLLIKSIDSYIVKDSESSFEKAIDEETLLKNYKVADTIEELCDIYVSVYENPLDNDFFWAHTYTPMEVKNFYNRYIPKEVYGAIWTDKGLIYVAKMNPKGNLELL